MQVLDTVNLNHIVTREGGWDTAADWKVRMMLDMIMIMVEIPAFSVKIFLLFLGGSQARPRDFWPCQVPFIF